MAGSPVLLAVTLTSLGQHDEATAQYEQAIREKPEDAGLHYVYATSLAQQGKPREAADQYRQTLALKPDMIEALNNLAWILAASPRDDARNGAEAIRFADRACELTQRREAVLLGTSPLPTRKAGRFREATETAEKARTWRSAPGRRRWRRTIASCWNITGLVGLITSRTQGAAEA